ncbi:hypothetical protein MetexDRAFT_2846 [Methylorubrum extorquens DSM 13060]|uniref:Uncharacterized protein n=3 Tax=Methylorubrum TaxID=2282523 RepID=H1KJN4_METEX|nr:hypothetical protein MetexDRAFT_2846 [Methylorubrum extorquens DSM 13060]
MQAAPAQYELMFYAATPVVPNTGEQSEFYMPTMTIICMTSNENPDNGFNMCFNENATGGFQSLLDFARAGLTKNEFANLVTSDEFPAAVEGTEGLPIEQRRWLLKAALPAVLYACGCKPSDDSNSTPAHANTITLPDLP